MAISSHQRERPSSGWLRRRYETARRRIRRLSEAVRVESPADVRTDYLRRLGDAWNVLGDARTIVENGWLQDRWEILPAPRTGDQPSGHGSPDIPVDGVRACLVTAVVRAAQRRDPSAGTGFFVAGPALD